MTITNDLRKEIETDIAQCETDVKREGSEALYGVLVAKYSVIDPDFSKGLLTTGKAAVAGEAFDFRPELKAIAAKLRMWLAISPKEDTEATTTTLKEKVENFIKRGERIKASEEYHSAKNGSPVPYMSGPNFNVWMNEINIFNERHLKGHPLHDKIYATYSLYKRNPSSYEEMIGYLRAVAIDREFLEADCSTSKATHYHEPVAKEIVQQRAISNKIFIVHGHDNAAKYEMARTLERAGFEAIILHEQANGGKTIIEKIEEYTDVAFAVVLYTPCDMGRAKEVGAEEEKSRARQNVVFEHGYLIGKLGRRRVCAFVKDDVETPGDISGVVYVPMDREGAWKTKLAKEMMKAGLEVDIGKFCE